MVVQSGNKPRHKVHSFECSGRAHCCTSLYDEPELNPHNFSLLYKDRKVPINMNSSSETRLGQILCVFWHLVNFLLDNCATLPHRSPD